MTSVRLQVIQLVFEPWSNLRSCLDCVCVRGDAYRASMLALLNPLSRTPAALPDTCHPPPPCREDKILHLQSEALEAERALFRVTDAVLPHSRRLLEQRGRCLLSL
jgi:hypothetical protein